MSDAGLKALRSGRGPTNPNRAWGRKPNRKCSCGHRRRGAAHDQGAHHHKGRAR